MGTKKGQVRKTGRRAYKKKKVTIGRGKYKGLTPDEVLAYWNKIGKM